MVKSGKVKPHQDVDHKDGNALNNGDSNLRARDRSQNRADNKHRIGEEYGAGFEGTDELLKTYIEGTPGQKKQHIVSKRRR